MDLGLLRWIMTPQCMEDLKIPPQLQFQISKHLNLAYFDLKLKIVCG
jgi:hypothetical protein